MYIANLLNIAKSHAYTTIILSHTDIHDAYYLPQALWHSNLQLTIDNEWHLGDTPQRIPTTQNILSVL